MLFFLIFIKLIFIGSKKEIELEVLIDKIFNSPIDSKGLYMGYCKEYRKQILNYRGRPTNIKDIINTKNKEDLSDYKYVYISELKDLDRVVEFQKSTIFLTYDPITVNETQYNKEYCYIDIKWKLEDYGPLYYIIIGTNVNKNLESYVIAILIVFFFIANIFIAAINIKSCNLKLFEQLVFYNFALIVETMSILLAISCLIINYCLLSHCIYSLFKSYMITNLIFYVDGYMNLHYDYIRNCIYGKFLLFFFIFESLCNLFFIYIIYFIPAVDNYNLFTIKSTIEHIILLLYTIKSIKKRFIPLYKQYLFETKLKTILAIAYKAKLMIYSKIIIFSLLYSIGILILPIIEMNLSIHEMAQVYYYHYYINIALEMLFGFILSIIFFPVKITVFYYLPIFYDYNSRKILVNINKEENKESNFNISNLSKILLNKKYKKEKLPIVLMKPFSENNNIAYKDIILGKTQINN